jgi:hypothetical protein
MSADEHKFLRGIEGLLKVKIDQISHEAFKPNDKPAGGGRSKPKSRGPRGGKPSFSRNRRSSDSKPGNSFSRKKGSGSKSNASGAAKSPGNKAKRPHNKKIGSKPKTSWKKN